MSFWDIIWFIVVSFAFIAYLMMMFNILGDLVRDRSTSGGGGQGALAPLSDRLPVPHGIRLSHRARRGMAQRSGSAASAADRHRDEPRRLPLCVGRLSSRAGVRSPCFGKQGA